jgi:hypothetical protein
VPTGRVVEEPFKPKLTELGEKHPVTNDLPGSAGPEPSWGRWFRVVEADPRDAEVLMKGADDKPLLVIGERGQGRVALLLSDHTWLWARGYEGGGPYTDLLRRLAHWLMKEPDLEEETLKAIELATNGWEISLARKQLLEIRRLMREGTQRPAWTKPLTVPVSVLAIALILVSLAGIWR